jgi:hypothetical protein
MPVCPFCGIMTETPHENQLGCLAALAAEIARLRRVLEHSEPVTVSGPATEPDEPDSSDPESR